MKIETHIGKFIVKAAVSNPASAFSSVVMAMSDISFKKIPSPGIVCFPLMPRGHFLLPSAAKGSKSAARELCPLDSAFCRRSL